MSILFGYKYISPVGSRWGQVSAEFPIKKSSYSDQLLLKKTHNLTHFTMPKSTVNPNFTRLGAYAPRLDRLTRLGAPRPGSSGLLAPSALEPAVAPATMRQFKSTDGNLLGRCASSSDSPGSRLGPCPPLLGRLLRIHSTPSRNNKFKIRELPLHKNSFF